MKAVLKEGIVYSFIVLTIFVVIEFVLTIAGLQWPNSFGFPFVIFDWEKMFSAVDYFRNYLAAVILGFAVAFVKNKMVKK